MSIADGVESMCYNPLLSGRYEVARVALVGCGAVAETFYLPAITKNPGLARNMVLVDTDASRAQAMAMKFRISSYVQDYGDVIPNVHGAIITLPNHLHFKVSLDFLSAGVHVLCEKPLCETEEQAKTLVKEAETRKVFLSVNNTRRLFPSFKKVKELIEMGEIGEPLSFHIEEGLQFTWPTVSGFYFNPKHSKGGVLMDVGAHVVDLICWWFNSRPEVTAYTDDSFGGLESVAQLELQVMDSIHGSVRLSRLSTLSNQYIIEGNKATIVCEPYNWQVIRLSKGGRTYSLRAPAHQRHYADFATELVNNFIDTLCGHAVPRVQGKDVIDSISVLEECYRKRQRFQMPWEEVSTEDEEA